MSINFSALPYDAWYGRAIRWPLKLIPSNLVAPILQGPLRGKKWIVGSSVHGCWLGSYEIEKAKLMKQRIGPGAVVFDIGAQAGYHTLLSSECAGPGGSVYAFEPLPRNLKYLHAMVELHRLKNVAVMESAVSDFGGPAFFDANSDPVAGRLSANGSMRVRCIQLDEEVQAGRLPPPTFLKIDVEGAEMKLLAGARHTLERHRPEIVLDTHTFLGGEFAPLHERCSRFLQEVGYQLRPIGMSSHEAREIHAIPTP